MTSFIGIDVGTGSARAGIFDARGNLLAAHSQAIATEKPKQDFVNQSSRDIWAAISTCVRKTMADAGLAASDIAGIGFDATCSLVVVDEKGGPVTVSPGGDDDWNIIVWMDHRAIGDADQINALKSPVLDYVGGVISPEMETPKLRWLKREMPKSFERAHTFFDLPDWLVHKATGDDIRSLCSTVCKWTYLGQNGTAGEGWDKVYFESAGISELAADNFRAIGNRFAAPGDKVGSLSDAAAADLGLAPGTAVAASLIDAYSGALGTMGVNLGDGALDERLALIAGTSSCHITVSEKPAFVPGVWGPYFSVLLPGLWANEAGQSAAGALIDRVIEGHAAITQAREMAKAEGISVFTLFDRRLEAMADDGETAVLTKSRHVQPDFHGNRSPLADPLRKGGITGFSLDRGLDDLALDYLATLQALAYGTRHIIAEMRANGVTVDTLVVSGGLAQNRLFLREHADATGCAIVVPDQREPVLVGSAMLGAVASGHYADLPAAMRAMSGPGSRISPRGAEIATYHDRKYHVFRRMQEDFVAYAELMAGTDH
ncbi:FGGY-family carbohydrate kinase [Rhizobium sp.]|uniref:FGGY-family carbohydrate kinase n=1 Tax=Rhizobium sp. TaxID=391 RepID=UPI0028AB9E03